MAWYEVLVVLSATFTVLAGLTALTAVLVKVW
jgi:hypothetical protein